MKIALRYLAYLFRIQYSSKGKNKYIKDFYERVIKSKRTYYAFLLIEKQRASFLNNHQSIEVTDFGAGSKGNSSTKRQVSYIAKTSAKAKNLTEILFKTSLFLESERIIELGTSLGISTAYLASVSSKSKVYSLEGCPNIAGLAKKSFKKIGLRNIEVINGNIDETLKIALSKENVFDLIYLDANHQYEPTINYFEQCLTKIHSKSVLIFDDIHWSEEMEKAWEQIKKHPQVTVSVDLFHFGLIFFNSEFEKEHLTLFHY